MAAAAFNGKIFAPAGFRRTMIWLHGLGDSADGFYGIFSEMYKIPGWRVVLPNAPNQPVTLN
jgi:predicted esterase